MTEKVRILGISGTPVKGGNMDTVVQEALKAAESTGDVETEFIPLADKKTAMCIQCQRCIKEQSGCKAFNDDTQKIYERMNLADGFILGAPAWLLTVGPMLTILLSRARSVIFFSHQWRNKPVGAVTVGWFGVGMENCIDQIEAMSNNFQMLPVASGRVIVSTAAKGERADYTPNGALDDINGMRTVRNVGLRVAEVAKMMKYASKANLVPAKFQPQRYT